MRRKYTTRMRIMNWRTKLMILAAQTEAWL